PDSLLGRGAGSGARLLSPREHGPRVRAARRVGGDPRTPRSHVVLVPPHAQLQGGPGLYDRRGRPTPAGVRRAAGQETLALHPLYGGWLVPDRDGDRPAALPQRRLHRLRVPPLAGLARPDAASLAAHRPRGAISSLRGACGRGNHRGDVPDAAVRAALAAARAPALPRERTQWPHAAKHLAPSLRAVAAVSDDRRVRRRRREVPRDAFPQTRQSARRDAPGADSRICDGPLPARAGVRWKSLRASGPGCAA